MSDNKEPDGPFTCEPAKRAKLNPPDKDVKGEPANRVKLNQPDKDVEEPGEDNEENSVDSADWPFPCEPAKRPKLNQPDKDVEVNTNFQGYDLKKCVSVPEYCKWVYVPPEYGAHTRAQWFPKPIPAQCMCHCEFCHLQPCITVEYIKEIDKAFPKNTMETEETELVLMLCRAYRKAVLDQCGKTFMEILMPNDNQLPQCAVEYCVRTARRLRGNMLDYDDGDYDGRIHWYSAPIEIHDDDGRTNSDYALTQIHYIKNYGRK